MGHRDFGDSPQFGEGQPRLPLKLSKKPFDHLMFHPRSFAHIELLLFFAGCFALAAIPRLQPSPSTRGATKATHRARCQSSCFSLRKQVVATVYYKGKARLAPNCLRRIMRTTTALLVILVWTNTLEAQKRKPKTPPKVNVSVTAEELQKDYADNPVAADKKYRLKTLEVTGKIKEIGRVPMSSSTYVLFETDGEIAVVAHFFKENENLILKVKRGDTVSIDGTGAGITKEKKIYISRCSSLNKVEEGKD